MWRNLRWAALLLVAIIPLSVAAQNPTAPNKREGTIIASVRAVLEAQSQAWNRGDIEGFMDGYERSPDTVFVSGDSVARGWQTVLDRYKKRYDTRDKMGTLSFSDLEVTLLSKDAALALCSWRLKRANDEPHGKSSLLLRRTKRGWKIVHDHSSAAS